MHEQNIANLFRHINGLRDKIRLYKTFFSFFPSNKGRFEEIMVSYLSSTNITAEEFEERSKVEKEPLLFLMRT